MNYVCCRWSIGIINPDCDPQRAKKDPVEMN